MTAIPDFKYRLPKGNTKTFVEIYKTDDVALAGLIKEVLDDNNILCYLGNYHFAHLYHPFVSPIQIMVYREDVEEANQLLSLFFQAE